MWGLIEGASTGDSERAVLSVYKLLVQELFDTGFRAYGFDDIALTHLVEELFKVAQLIKHSCCQNPAHIQTPGQPTTYAIQWCATKLQVLLIPLGQIKSSVLLSLGVNRSQIYIYTHLCECH